MASNIFGSTVILLQSLILVLIIQEATPFRFKSLFGEKSNAIKRFFMPTATEKFQNEECLKQVEAIKDNIGKYQKLRDIQNEDDDTFYSCLIRQVDTLLPIVYTPIVGEVCESYGRIKGDRGIMLKITEPDLVKTKLKEWKKSHPETRAIVVTDGNRILGLGDLGANGMGIPIGKMIIYSALGGVNPKYNLPVTLDVGTNNEALLKDNTGLYVGLNQKRETGEKYNNFVDTFVNTAIEVFGPHTLVQFEDFAYENAFKFLRQYQRGRTVFNDDIQGTAAVALGGLLAAERISDRKLRDSRILFAGAGGAGIGIANLIVRYLKELNIPEDKARRRIFFKRSQSLIMEGDKIDDNDDKRFYAKKFKQDVPEGANVNDLLEIIKWLKPNILIGVSSQPGLFDERVLRAMAEYNNVPIVFALSNPTSKSECTAEEAYRYAKGVLFASGSPFGSVKLDDSKETRYPRQCNNAYVFPGVALAITAAQMTEVPEHVFLIAAKVLGKECTLATDINQGSLFPSLDRLRQCSVMIATAIAEYAFKEGLSALEEKPEDVRKFILNHYYTPEGVDKIEY